MKDTTSRRVRIATGLILAAAVITPGGAHAAQLPRRPSYRATRTSSSPNVR
ncbi:hypothetical protein [Mobilicoccus caccae]|uniref:hypothetical protein n=1 Tax=Mobilicoccus caccae TaxID=1859295 RepID=UPI0024E0B67E|nr:hypothetical protein [Mobilicoccus caccae]